MATTEKQPAPAKAAAPAPQSPATPALGGSYTVDEQTGEHTLIERTQEPTKE